MIPGKPQFTQGDVTNAANAAARREANIGIRVKNSADLIDATKVFEKDRFNPKRTFTEDSEHQFDELGKHIFAEGERQREENEREEKTAKHINSGTNIGTLKYMAEAGVPVEVSGDAVARARAGNPAKLHRASDKRPKSGTRE